jgi:hypothetical protein
MPLSWSQLASLLGPPGPMAPQVATIASPTADATHILLRAPRLLSISRVDAVLSGGTSPSVSFSLRHGADVSTAGTAVTTEPITASSTTTGFVVSNFQAAAISAEHWLWLDVISLSGAPQSLTVVVQFN